jgi:hypothetical protein
LAEVAQRASAADVDIHGDVEFAGGIDSGLGDLVRGAAAILVDHVWHPWSRRWAINRRLSRSRRVVGEARQKTDRTPLLDWDEPRA